MFTGLSTAFVTGWTQAPPVRPTPEQEAAHTAAYGAYMDHAGSCADCMTDDGCETGRALRRVLREAGR
jgi:hypothetical protein